MSPGTSIWSIVIGVLVVVIVVVPTPLLVPVTVSTVPTTARSPGGERHWLLGSKAPSSPASSETNISSSYGNPPKDLDLPDGEINHN